MTLKKHCGEKGDFTKIAALCANRGGTRQIPWSDHAAAASDLAARRTTAVPLAMLGAEVVGIDIAGTGRRWESKSCGGGLGTAEGSNKETRATSKGSVIIRSI